jgi:hypothetical protein
MPKSSVQCTMHACSAAAKLLLLWTTAQQLRKDVAQSLNAELQQCASFCMNLLQVLC